MTQKRPELFKRPGLESHHHRHHSLGDEFGTQQFTTLAALLGVLPIAIGIGAGAELRQPLGVALVGGLLVSQVLMLYIYMEQLAAGARNIYAKIWKARAVPQATS